MSQNAAQVMNRGVATKDCLTTGVHSIGESTYFEHLLTQHVFYYGQCDAVDLSFFLFLVWWQII